ncbi:hypothetical protein ACEWY4_025148 [Coilia grayii]|uniref:BHLH domain-containing protein n=1 Tax=Coilia grayii TaxID=363190 RepID=A0ABD1IXS1_9TELE
MSSVMSLKQKQRAHRKSSKPMMERRRRARINACLAQLHTLLTQARATQICRRSRLEKADILELTVRHIKSLTSKKTDATLWSQFYSGYTDCAREASRFLSVSSGHPLRSTTIHPSAEISAVNTGKVDCLDNQLNSRWPSPALCKMCTFNVAEKRFNSAPKQVCSHVVQQRQRSAETTTRRESLPQVVSQKMKTEHKPGIGNTDVWRPW